MLLWPSILAGIIVSACLVSKLCFVGKFNYRDCIGIQCEYNCGHNKLIYGYIGHDVIPKLNPRQVFPAV